MLSFYCYRIFFTKIYNNIVGTDTESLLKCICHVRIDDFSFSLAHPDSIRGTNSAVAYLKNDETMDEFKKCIIHVLSIFSILRLY